MYGRERALLAPVDYPQNFDLQQSLNGFKYKISPSRTPSVPLPGLFLHQ